MKKLWTGFLKRKDRYHRKLGKTYQRFTYLPGGNNNIQGLRESVFPRGAQGYRRYFISLEHKETAKKCLHATIYGFLEKQALTGQDKIEVKEALGNTFITKNEWDDVDKFDPTIRPLLKGV